MREANKAFLVGLLEGILIGALLAGCMSRADTPTLHRHTDPPTPTLSCTDELAAIRKGLVDVSIQESILWDSRDRQTSDFYLRRAAEARRTKDLNVSYVNCLRRNIQELNIVLASWQYQYAQDQEIIHAGK